LSRRAIFSTFSASFGSSGGGEGRVLPAGLYLYRLTAGGFRQTRTMVWVR